MKDLQLNVEDIDTRRQSLLKLHGVSFLDHKEIFDRALGDIDWRVRAEAVSAVASCTPISTVVENMLIVISETRDVGLRNAALSVLDITGVEDERQLKFAYSQALTTNKPFVIQAIGQSKRATMIPFLHRVIEGSDSNSAAAAVDAVVAIGSAEAVAVLRGLLNSQNVFQQVAAIEGLARLNAVLRWEEIEPLLQNSIARRVAVGLLGRVDHEDALTMLLDLLDDRSKATVTAAICSIDEQLHRDTTLNASVKRAFTQRGQDRVRRIREILFDGDTEARQSAAYLCTLIADVDSLEGIVSVVSEGLATQETLLHLQGWGIEAVEGLFSLRGTSGLLWATALELAAEIAFEHRQALPMETETQLRDEIDLGLRASFEVVRVAAVKALKWWGRQAHIVPIKEMVLGDSVVLSRAAAQSFEYLGQAYPSDVCLVLRDLDFDKEFAVAFVSTLAQVQSTAATSLLRRGLDARSAQTRAACVRALASASDNASVEDLIFALTDEDPDVQLASINALSRTQGPDAIMGLFGALDSNHCVVRAAAIESLCRSDLDGLSPRLAELALDEASVVIAAAIRAMKFCENEAFSDTILRALSHEDEEVVKSALDASTQLVEQECLGALRLGIAHSSWHVRIVAADLLGRCPIPEARIELQTRLAIENDEMVAERIALVLDRGQG